MKRPIPRECSWHGVPTTHSYKDGTWIEAEEFAYGKFTRRAYAVCPDGKKRVVMVSIPDTMFSIPARMKIDGKTVKGFITTPEGESVLFTADKEQ
jgi:hypothetical protein